MKEIIVLNGSPRLMGNTVCAVKYLLNGMAKKADFEYTEINLTKEDLKPCFACNVCKKNGGICVTDRASAVLIEKVLNSDVILLATPVYWWGVSAQLKIAIDKFYSKSDIMGEMKKKIILVTVGAAPVDDPQYELIRKQIEFICSHSNWELIGHVKASAFEADELASNPEILNKIELEGQKLAYFL